MLRAGPPASTFGGLRRPVSQGMEGAQRTGVGLDRAGEGKGLRDVSHLPQDLHDVFPGDEALLRRLKLEDHHFRSLADRYATLDQEISQIGLELQAASDERTEDLKKQRLLVLDEIAGVIQAARPVA
jgi:hypothetical protein